MKIFTKKRNKKGFTLIELIVVIVIIGILAAIAIPRLSGFTDRANAQTCKANQKTMNTALATRYAETGSYPALDDSQFLDLLDGKTLPVCPSGGTYSKSADGDKVVCSEAGH